MPRILLWLTGLLGGVQVAALLFILNAPYPVKDLITVFDHVSQCEEKPSPAPLTTDGITEMLEQPMHVAEDCWRPAILPENNPPLGVTVDVRHPKLRRIWYRGDYQIPKDWDVNKPLMVYLPRINASAWQVMINGQSIADDRFEWRSTWNRPVAALFFAEKNQATYRFDVGVIAPEADGYSIARITVGDAAAVHNKKALRAFLQVTMPQASSAVMLLLGGFFLLIWWARRSETEYLLLAFSSFVYCIINLKFVISQITRPDFDFLVNIFLNEIANYWIGWLIYLITARFAHFSCRWLERVFWLFTLGSNLLAIVLCIYGQNDYGTLRGILNFLVQSTTIGIMIWHCILMRTTELRIIAMALIGCTAAGINDALLMLNVTNPEGLLLSSYFGFGLFAAYFYAIQCRYVAAITGHEQINIALTQQLTEREILTQQLTAKEAELRNQQHRLLELERAQTLAEERQRLMHDIHDGLGSSLLTTLSAIEKSNLPQHAVAEALRACIEDLRLIIDSLEPTANDLVTLLGTIRYRLGQRLDKAGLELQWEINDLPILPWLEPPDALNVLRLVQEALVNVLKHANATSIRVTTYDLGDKVEIRITDNGCGYDLDNITPGRGTQSQIKRIQRLGGDLRIESVVGRGTSFRLQLPIYKDPQPAA